MRLENMEQEFPKMPEEMRAMIEQEVAKQVKVTSHTTYHRRKHMARRSFVAALVAAMTLGTTVFAGVIFQMHSKSVGKYAVETTIDKNETEGGSSVIATTENQLDIPTVRMEVGYLPEGMIEVEEGKYSYAKTPYQGGVSIVFYRMDTGDEAFEMLDTYVTSSEEINIGGREAIYLEMQEEEAADISFNQRIYVAYTDVHYVMEMYVGSDVSKEEALKVAEGISLTPVEDDATGDDIVKDYDWSDYVETLAEDAENADTELYSNTSVTKSEMKNTHKIGESFALYQADEGAEACGLQVKVADVQIADNVNLLDLSVMDEEEKEELNAELDENGNLLPAKLEYVKYGDGIDTLYEVVKTREASQKLVYATVEYTNAGDTALSEVLFMGSLAKMTEDGDNMKMYYGEEPQNGEDWDEVCYTGNAMHQEMWYYDVHGGERGNNYITSIKPGETVTVHMAWIVPEEELGYLYLNMDTYGGSYEYSEHSLAVGYVDIRQ